MKQELQRIEVALQLLNRHDTVQEPSSGSESQAAPVSTSSKRALSFELLSSAHSQARSVESVRVQPFPLRQDPEPPLAEQATLTQPPGDPELLPGDDAIRVNNLLQELEAVVESWSVELDETLAQIRSLYLEGPIVEGWLESQTAQTGYRLCGLDAEGQSWSYPCPPEQLLSVSLAIARYQKLRQLLHRKQHLENRFSHLAHTLSELRDQLP